jgi:cell division septum initiation protein DivIVA
MFNAPKDLETKISNTHNNILEYRDIINNTKNNLIEEHKKLQDMTIECDDKIAYYTKIKDELNNHLQSNNELIMQLNDITDVKQ